MPQLRGTPSNWNPTTEIKLSRSVLDKIHSHPGDLVIRMTKNKDGSISADMETDFHGLDPEQDLRPRGATTSTDFTGYVEPPHPMHYTLQGRFRLKELFQALSERLLVKPERVMLSPTSAVIYFGFRLGETDHDELRSIAQEFNHPFNRYEIILQEEDV